MSFKYFSGYSNKISFNINTVEVAGDVRTIRAQWTPEAAQDLQAFHGINVEQELTNMLAEEIGREIDNNFILPMIRRVAAQTIGLDLVRVQPLELPSGQLFYFDINYGYNILKNFKYFR